MLGTTEDNVVIVCRLGLVALKGGRECKTEIREAVVVSHNFQQRGAVEAGDVKFAVGQHMGSAVMLPQEKRNWPGGQSVLSGYELYTDVVAIQRGFACDVSEKVCKKVRVCCYVRHCLGFSLHCHNDVSQNDLCTLPAL